MECRSNTYSQVGFGDRLAVRLDRDEHARSFTDFNLFYFFVDFFMNNVIIISLIYYSENLYIRAFESFLLYGRCSDVG